jgi:hypothetical protein
MPASLRRGAGRTCGRTKVEENSMNSVPGYEELTSRDSVEAQLELLILVPHLDQAQPVAGCGCGAANGCGSGGACQCGSENGCGQ